MFYQQQMDIEQINQMNQEIEKRKSQLEEQQREMRPLLSDEEYKQLIETHKQELRNLQNKLDVQRRRQHQNMLDKLAARRAKKVWYILIICFSADMINLGENQEDKRARITPN